MSARASRWSGTTLGIGPGVAPVVLFLVLFLGLFLGLFVGGCTVGSGSGAASGPIFVLGCGTNGQNYGTPDKLQFFNLSPQFFAGEPIDDIAVSNKANRLLMRLQRNGNRIEITDTLRVDVQNAYEVARCVRGRLVNGAPDYDTRMTTSLFTELPTTTPWCDWSWIPTADGGDALADGDAGAGDADVDVDGDASALDGGGDAGAGVTPVRAPHARIHLGTEELVTASLSPLFTCRPNVTGLAGDGADVTGVAFDGWVDFQDFGSAAQPDLPPEQRGMISPDFKVNFGERLRATFEVDLGDQAIYGAVKARRPIPGAQIGGSLSGFFDFDLDRGRAAQPFP